MSLRLLFLVVDNDWDVFSCWNNDAYVSVNYFKRIAVGIRLTRHLCVCLFVALCDFLLNLFNPLCIFLLLLLFLFVLGFLDCFLSEAFQEQLSLESLDTHSDHDDQVDDKDDTHRSEHAQAKKLLICERESQREQGQMVGDELET